MNDKRQVLAKVMIPVVILLVGFVAGYLVWGSNGEKAPDYAALLKDSAYYLKTVERSNAKLMDETALLKEQIQQLRSESMPEDPDDQVKQYQSTIENLQKENTQLKTAKAENQRLQEDTKRLEEQMRMATAEIDQLKEQTSALQASQEGRQALYEENEQLKEKLADYLSEKGVLERQMADQSKNYGDIVRRKRPQYVFLAANLAQV